MLQRIKTSQEWNKFLESRPGGIHGNELLQMREACYRDIEILRGRPIIVYASNFNAPHGSENSIDLNDVDGFNDLVSSLPDSSSIDVLIHSPGGRPDGTERIVQVLRGKYEEVHFLIPHSAYSAATMLALSGDSITLHSSATLGPIDPQINGMPARSIKRGFENAKENIIQKGPEALPAYIPLIEKLSLELLELCVDSEKLSKNLVSAWIREYMFKGKELKKGQIRRAVDFFSDYDKHLIHSRPLNIGRLEKFGLKIYPASSELEILLWEAYVNINGFFGASHFVKLFENPYGVSWGKQFQQFIMPQPPPRNN